MTTSDASALLLDSALKSLPILLGALILLRGLRRSSAAVRHAAGTAAVIGLIALPLLSLSLPVWRVARPNVLSGWLGTNPRGPGSPKGERSAESARSPSLSPVTATPVVSNSPVRLGDESLVQPETHFQQSPGPRGLDLSHPSLGWPTWVYIVYFLGTSVLLIRTASGLAATRRLLRSAEAVTHGPWIDTLAHIGKPGVKVRLMSCAELAVPVTCGLVGSRILVPSGSESWPDAQRRSVLLHELAHARRRDCLTHFLGRIACALYWFNPLVWLLDRHNGLSREQACDDAVLTSGAVYPSDYAQTLVNLTRQLRSHLIPPGALAMARTSQLEPRIKAILEETRKRTGLKHSVVVTSLVLIVLAISPLAMIRVTNADESADDKETPAQELSHVVEFQFGDIEFYGGDSVTITEIKGTSPTFERGGTYRVKGRYTLASRDRASLAFYITATKPEEGTEATKPDQVVEVSKGSGEFSLIKTFSHTEGYPHVTFYPVPQGSGFGGLYFGQPDTAFTMLRHKSWSYRQAAAKEEEKKESSNEPPVVTSTTPAAGSKDVDPALTEIKVTYSKAMMDGSWSWSTDTGLGEFPETTGKPRYLEDKKTCLLPVKLKPDTTYAIRLNSNKFGNFKDAEGRSAEPYLLTFRTGEAKEGEVKAKEETVVVSPSLTVRMNRNRLPALDVTIEEKNGVNSLVSTSSEVRYVPNPMERGSIDPKLTVESIAHAENVRVVRYNMGSRKEPKSALGKVLQLAAQIAPPELVTDTGKRYGAIGYVRKSGAATIFKIDPNNKVRSVAELNLGQLGAGDQLYLFFHVDVGETIKRFEIGRGVKLTETEIDLPVQ